MLAGKADLSKLTYPVLVSAKYDGVRAYVENGVVYSRNNKPIPNEWVQRRFGMCNGLDGELIVGDEVAPDVFRRTQSEVMSIDGEPDVLFYAFDHYPFPTAPFRDRISFVARFAAKHKHVVLVEHTLCPKRSIVDKEERKYIELGYEGIMIRDPLGPYKFGRSTALEGYLLKLKRFADSEAVIIDVEEEMHNANEKGDDGKRTSHKAGMVPKGTLGALRVKDCTTGSVFNVGSGFSAGERIHLWRQRRTLPGKIITYKYFPVGVKDAPRFPTFVGFREDL